LLNHFSITLQTRRPLPSRLVPRWQSKHLANPQQRHYWAWPNAPASGDLTRPKRCRPLTIRFMTSTAPTPPISTASPKCT